MANVRGRAGSVQQPYFNAQVRVCIANASFKLKWTFKLSTIEKKKMLCGRR